jgi:hypothetical protein
MKSKAMVIACHCAIVGLVSIYDMVLTVLYAPYLKSLEQNPMGRWLMQLDQISNNEVPDLTLFLSLKSLLTVLVLTVLALLHCKYRRIGQPVAMGVTSFQILLAMYLTFSTNTPP